MVANALETSRTTVWRRLRDASFWVWNWLGWASCRRRIGHSECSSHSMPTIYKSRSYLSVRGHRDTIWGLWLSTLCRLQGSASRHGFYAVIISYVLCAPLNEPFSCHKFPQLPQKCYMLRLLLEQSNNHKRLFVCLFITRSRINEWYSGSTFSDKWKIESRSLFVLHITAIYSNSVVKLRNILSTSRHGTDHQSVKHDTHKELCAFIDTFSLNIRALKELVKCI